jgi:hypothetical protein
MTDRNVCSTDEFGPVAVRACPRKRGHGTHRLFCQAVLAEHTPVTHPAFCSQMLVYQAEKFFVVVGPGNVESA